MKLLKTKSGHILKTYCRKEVRNADKRKIPITAEKILISHINRRLSHHSRARGCERKGS